MIILYFYLSIKILKKYYDSTANLKIIMSVKKKRINYKKKKTDCRIFMIVKTRDILVI